MAVACVIDVAGPVLTVQERRLFAARDPWAFILFGRSCETPAQVRALCEDLRDSVGRACLIFIDQEGGRVQRLAPPVWPRLPALSFYGRLWQDNPELALEACNLHHQIIGQMLSDVGIDANCAPCLDLRLEGASNAIGDRALSADPKCVAELGQAGLAGLQAAGVAGVLKHMPGQGRAALDSHEALPRIAASKEVLQQDLLPFRTNQSAPMGMIGHVVFEEIDPVAPASQSAPVVQTWIREAMGFDGLLMTDDLTMKALDQPDEVKAARVFGAGIDIAMRCHGTLEERDAFLQMCPALSGPSLARAMRAEAYAPKPAVALQPDQLWARFTDLTGWERNMTLSISPDPTRKAWA
ncbi:MAG: beta-hexosaminidase [Aquidulcibacter sp.]|jgi:beta-N-acetylhexosaminidase|uniref:glycoside hydrolase family 3 N-terminal domain-containing protein n=1 Tax=Aquidulcibacter sp. TaxID=2052990 RepID=UPI0022CA5646|nr:glycoside hydrolase family 3 N-terminal domain-containing protein [Aquidulcibacter sp.]MCZ8208397.1 beta-hexosaminidase [Aquidulcibacter sp.]